MKSQIHEIKSWLYIIYKLLWGGVVNNNDFLTKIQVLDSSITSIDKTTDLNRVTTFPSQTFTSDNLFSTTESKMPIYVWIENNTINYYSGATNIDLNNN